jgi:hypothetical protein
LTNEEMQMLPPPHQYCFDLTEDEGRKTNAHRLPSFVLRPPSDCFILNRLVVSMLYLIGGAPRCGKTTLARQLAQALGCSHVPADYLGTAFANYIPISELPQRYPAWGTTTAGKNVK